MQAARVLLGLALVVGAVAACTGTSSVDIPSPTTTAAPNEPAPADTAVPHGSAIANVPVDAGIDAAIPPAPPLCTVETEPNDVATAASSFASCFGGALATAADRDFWTFTAPAGATTLVVSHTESAPVAYRIYENTPFGSFFAVSFTGAAPPIAVTSGATYLIRLSVSGAQDDEGDAPRTYEVTPTFQ